MVVIGGLAAVGRSLVDGADKPVATKLDRVTGRAQDVVPGASVGDGRAAARHRAAERARVDDEADTDRLGRGSDCHRAGNSHHRDREDVHVNRGWASTASALSMRPSHRWASACVACVVARSAVAWANPAV